MRILKYWNITIVFGQTWIHNFTLHTLQEETIRCDILVGKKAGPGIGLYEGAA